MNRETIIKGTARRIGQITLAEIVGVNNTEFSGSIRQQVRAVLEANDVLTHHAELVAALRDIERGVDDPAAIATEALALLPGRGKEDEENANVD